MYPLYSKPKPGTMLNPLHPLSKGLRGCWLFNEGTGSGVRDISSKGNHGNFVNKDTGWVGSKFGGGLEFDGTDDYLDCGNDKSLDIINEISIVAWINPNTTHNDWSDILEKGEYGTSCYVLEIWDVNSTVNFRINTSNFVVENLFIPDEWHLYAWVYDGTYRRVYRDGIHIESVATSGSISTSTTNLQIGGYDQYFKGAFDTMCLYDRGLSVKEVKQLYNSPFCNFISSSLSRYYVVPVGWTGIINGVTNPAEICGVSVADIIKVNGVA